MWHCRQIDQLGSLTLEVADWEAPEEALHYNIQLQCGHASLLSAENDICVPVMNFELT